MAAQSGIFICPSCQGVVKGGLKGGKGLVCPECNHEFRQEAAGDPLKKTTAVPAERSGSKSSSVIRDLTGRKSSPIKSVEREAAPKVVAKSLEEAQAEMNALGSDDEMIMPDGTRRVRRRKRKKKDEKNKGLILFLLGWFCVILIIFALFKVGQKDGGEKVSSPDDPPKKDLEGVMTRLLPEVGKRFQQFLLHATMDGREQFIDHSAELSLPFSEFYAVNVFPKPESKLRRVDENVLSFSDDKIAIETIWESENGLKWGAVHVFDKTDGWKLDWENFAPYSSESWNRFRSGLGKSEGVFRLLVRKRFSSDREEEFYLSFYRAPQVFERENEYKNTQSPEVEVAAESELGRKFLGLWGDYLEGRSPYGSILPKKLDPQNHMRITARLAWEEDDDGEKVMTLKEIIGVGWFGKRIQEFHEEAVRKVTEEATGKLSETPVEEP